MPSNCEPNEMPRIASAPSGASATSRATVRSSAATQRSGSCSAHVGYGNDRSYASYADATSVPSAAYNAEFVPWLPTSQPMTYGPLVLTG